jgi:hypothetical protein
LKEKTGKRWFWRVLDFINPLRDPSLTVAAVLTFIEEAGQHDPWYIIVIIALVNWLAVRGVVWLVVNFTFASTFLARRLWWAIRHPRLAWRIMDAIGHEEIIIGGLPTLSEGVLLQDGTAIMSPMLGASGIQVLGELPAGTEVPMIGMSNGQMPADLSNFAASGFFPGMNGGNGFGAPDYQNAGAGNGYVSTQSTDGLPQSFPRHPSEEEERLRQQLAAYSRLLDDWIQYTEEKWRTVSDSQLGWKPLRGRWSSWDDIFQDVYAAKTSDPMAQAAQSAGEATSRRFEHSRDKGSAASAVACFMRDMMTLRRGLDIMQQGMDPLPETSDDLQTVTQRFPNKQRFGGGSSGLLRNNSGLSPRNSLIRRPAPIFVDADRE